jgi:hypothetical protein
MLLVDLFESDMALYSIWFDSQKDGGKYSVVDASTREPILGRDGKPLTDLSLKQAIELIEKLERESRRR